MRFPNEVNSIIADMIDENTAKMAKKAEGLREKYGFIDSITPPTEEAEKAYTEELGKLMKSEEYAKNRIYRNYFSTISEKELAEEAVNRFKAAIDWANEAFKWEAYAKTADNVMRFAEQMLKGTEPPITQMIFPLKQNRIVIETIYRTVEAYINSLEGIEGKLIYRPSVLKLKAPKTTAVVEANEKESYSNFPYGRILNLFSGTLLLGGLETYSRIKEPSNLQTIVEEDGQVRFVLQNNYATDKITFKGTKITCGAYCETFGADERELTTTAKIFWLILGALNDKGLCEADGKVRKIFLTAEYMAEKLGMEITDFRKRLKKTKGFNRKLHILSSCRFWAIDVGCDELPPGTVFPLFAKLDTDAKGNLAITMLEEIKDIVFMSYIPKPDYIFKMGNDSFRLASYIFTTIFFDANLSKNNEAKRLIEKKDFSRAEKATKAELIRRNTKINYTTLAKELGIDIGELAKTRKWKEKGLAPIKNAIKEIVKAHKDSLGEELKITFTDEGKNITASEAIKNEGIIISIPKSLTEHGQYVERLIENLKKTVNREKIETEAQTRARKQEISAARKAENKEKKKAKAKEEPKITIENTDFGIDENY